MTELNLSKMDAQLLAASALLTAGITATGGDGATALQRLEDEYPKIAPLTASGVILLTHSKPVKLTDMIVEEEGIPLAERNRQFVANLQRVGQLARELLTYSASDTTAATPAVAAPGAPLPPPKVIDVDKEGNPVFEPQPDAGSDKLYGLQLTHKEIHLLFWALQVAEAARAEDAQRVTDDSLIYTEAFRKLGDAGLDRFVSRFNGTHQQARIDDGE